jgi:hypothetical protein
MRYVTGAVGLVPRDDRAWPRGAAVTSSAIATVALGAGVALGFAAADRGVLKFGMTIAAFVVAFGFAVAVWVPGLRRWIAGHPTPVQAQLWGMAGLVIAIVVMSIDPTVGFALIAGLIGGMSLANVWAIRRARSNRSVVEGAEARAVTLDAEPAWAPPPSGETVGQALRHAVAVERKLWLAWLIADVAALTAFAAIDTLNASTFVVVCIGGLGFGWVTRRFLAAWLAVRAFGKATTPPRRAFVVLLHDPAPRMIRPVLGIWPEPPVPRQGRLPKPERVYRCDEDRVDLLSYQGHVVVHEAWLDTGPRRGSKSRWVAADAGVALPHRRAVFGRWYMSARLAGERPRRPRPLTLPVPHADQRAVIESHPDVGSLTIATATRLAILGGIGVVFSWIV